MLYIYICIGYIYTFPFILAYIDLRTEPGGRGFQIYISQYKRKSIYITYLENIYPFEYQKHPFFTFLKIYIQDMQSIY